MKQFISPVENGGAAVFAEDLIMMQGQSMLALIRTLKGLGASENVPLILSGCVVTDPGAGGAGTVDITEGYVYFNEEVMYVPSYSGSTSPALYLVEASPVITSRIFKDGSTQQIITERKTEWATSSSGAQYMEYTNNTLWELQRLKTIIKNYNDARISAVESSITSHEAAWTEITPSPASVVGGGSTTASAYFRYKKIGKTLFFELTVTGSISGNISSFALDLSAAFTRLSGGQFWGGVGQTLGGRLIRLTINPNSSSMSIAGASAANGDAYVNGSGDPTMGITASGCMEIA